MLYCIVLYCSIVILDGVKYAQKNNNGEFLFIEYSDLIADPKETIESIYKFCDIESFKHNFQK